MLEIKNNLALAQHLETFPPEQRRAEYQRLLPTFSFAVKSFGYLMKKYEAYKDSHGSHTAEG